MTRTISITGIILVFASPLLSQDVVINELMADNVSTIVDITDGGFDDWLELYNPGAAGVTLNGYFLTDDPGNPLQWPLPDTSIAAMGFLLVWADRDSTASGLHTNFALSKNGEFLALYRLAGTDTSVVDSLSFGPQAADISYGRSPDGSDSFALFAPATPGAPNTNITTIGNLFINELMADNVATVADPSDGMFDDWIELYNTTGATFNLNGYFLTDDRDNPAKWPFPSINISKEGFLIIWADADTLTGGLHTNFRLSRNGEFLGLYFDAGSDTILVDSLSFGMQFSDISFGRNPDGSDNFALLSTATPGLPNSGALVLPDLYINELMADNDNVIRDDTDGMFDDWVEIYNGGTDAVRLVNFFLTDDPDSPGKWPVPDTTIAAGDFLLVWADNDSTDPGLHTNFALSRNGDFVGLYVNTGVDTVLVDGKSFGPQLTDVSLGRTPDGGSQFVLFSVSTPGSSNDGGASFFENQIFINEFMAENTTTIQDTTDHNFDDWIELYNGGLANASLLNFYLTDDPTNPTRWRLPETILEPGGLLLIWADNDAGAGPSHANFRLSKNGEFVGLYLATAADTTVIDSLTFTAQFADTSFGRNPDGGQDFVLYAGATPGELNTTGVIVSVAQQSDGPVRTFSLQQNYPNPFNPETSIDYTLPAATDVKLTIFNLLGQRVAVLVEEKQTAGRYRVTWPGLDANGQTVASGVYLYRLEAGDFVQTHKMLLLR